MLLLGLLLLFVPNVAGRCDCDRRIAITQNLFCQADFVVEIQVKSMKTKKDTMTLSISNIKDEHVYYFRETQHKVDMKKILIFGKDCWVEKTSTGEPIKKKGVYIVSGRFRGRTLTMDKCSSIIMLASKVRGQMLRNLKSEYKEQCDKCQVAYSQYHISDRRRRSSSRGSSSSSMGRDRPTFGLSGGRCVAGLYDFKCRNANSVCQKRGNSCYWKQSSELETCFNKQPLDFFGQGFMGRMVRGSKKRKGRKG